VCYETVPSTLQGGQDRYFAFKSGFRGLSLAKRGCYFPTHGKEGLESFQLLLTTADTIDQKASEQKDLIDLMTPVSFKVISDENGNEEQLVQLTLQLCYLSVAPNPTAPMVLEHKPRLLGAQVEPSLLTYCRRL